MFKRLPAFLASIGIAAHTAAATIARWDFNSVPSDADPTTGTLAPAAGFGTATLVGGVTGSFTASNGSSDPNPLDNSNWRITTWPAQGAQNKQHGIRFSVGTAGYRNLALRWDLRASNTASKYVRLQYSTNGTGFVDFQVIRMPNEQWINGLTASFTGVPGVEDNPAFAVRFVTEFESTATGAGTNGYVAASATNSYGLSGTLRFDMLGLTGDAAVSQFSLLSYNVLGRDQPDWTTNSAQVQALGRQLAYLKPDIVGLVEIPETNANYLQMTNFVAAYLPGYRLAIGSRTDGGERSVVLSRFPIARSQSWLARSDLAPFGYSGVFTRDLFEAELALPGLPQPFHFFVTHLKAHSDEDSCLRRAAEARAITNYFVRGYLSTNALRPYALAGDLNEDIARPRPYEQEAIQTLTSPPTGLRLTTPRDPFNGDDRTWSIQNFNLTQRFDYLLPCALLASNVIASQVFRTDRVSPPAPPLLASDSTATSDHLPVTMTFRNPYTAPFLIRSLSLGNQIAHLAWQAVPGGRYRVDASADLIVWVAVTTILTAQGNELACDLSRQGTQRYYRVALAD